MEIYLPSDEPGNYLVQDIVVDNVSQIDDVSLNDMWTVAGGIVCKVTLPYAVESLDAIAALTHDGYQILSMHFRNPNQTVLEV